MQGAVIYAQIGVGAEARGSRPGGGRASVTGIGISLPPLSRGQPVPRQRAGQDEAERAVEGGDNCHGGRRDPFDQEGLNVVAKGSQ